MRSSTLIGTFLSALSLSLTAQTTTTTNTINACVGNLTGILREVSSSKECIKGLETFQQFNIQGPQGVQGPQGPAGPTGAIGAQGVAGAVGAPGTRGATGASGVAGAQGPVGATGAQGPAGPIGQTGSMGSQGPVGATGTPGAAGQGFNYRGTFSSSATYNYGDVVLFNNTLYIDTNNQNTVAGVQPDSGNGVYTVFLPAGMAGPAGAMGPQGSVGKNGLDGKNGTNGLDGKPGQTGPQGPSGPTGPAGTGSALNYYIHFYYQTDTIRGCSASASDCLGFRVDAKNIACPANEVPVAASCGYQSELATSDAHSLIVNYAGLDVQKPGQISCILTNTSSDSRNLTTGVSCLSTDPLPSGLTLPANTTKAVKSCTYDPDTQAPCTVSDAIAATEVAPGSFKAAENPVASNRKELVTESSVFDPTRGENTPKATKSVTLWFRE